MNNPPGQLGTLNLRVPITREGNGSLKAPDNAIIFEASARALYDGLRSQHINRIVTYSAIEGLISGNPPYPPNSKLNNLTCQRTHYGRKR